MSVFLPFSRGAPTQWGRKAIILILVLLSSAASYSSSISDLTPIVLTPHTDGIYHVSSRGLVFVDETYELTVDDLLSSEPRYLAITDKKSLGYSNASHWVIFKVENTTNKSTWFLRHNSPTTFNIDVYELDSQTRDYKRMSGGLALTQGEKSFADRLPTFELDIPSGRQRTYYVNILSPTTISMDLSLLSSGTYTKSSTIETLLFSLFYGWLLLVCVVNLISGVLAKHANHLLVGSISAMLLLAFVSADGYLSVLTSGAFGQKSYAVSVGLFGVALWLSMLYLIRELRCNRAQISVDLGLFVVVSITLLALVISPVVFDREEITSRLFLGSYGLIPISLSYLSAKSYFRGIQTLKIIPAAMLVLGAACAFHGLSLLVGFGGNSIAELIIRISIGFLLLILTLSFRENMSLVHSFAYGSFNKFKAVFDNSSASLALLNAKGEIVETNSCGKLFDAQLGSVKKGVSLWELDSLATHPELAYKIRSIFSEEKPNLPIHFTYEYQVGIRDIVYLDITLKSHRHEGAKEDIVVFSARDNSEIRRKNTLFKKVANKVSEGTGSEFFSDLVRNISEISGCDFATVSSLSQSDGEWFATTLAIVEHGVLSENITYSLSGTPCDDLVEKTTCTYEGDLKYQYPDDDYFKAHGIKGYCGRLLNDDAGNPIGLLVVLDDKEFLDKDEIAHILEIFSTRASSELIRQRTLDDVLDIKQRLTQLIEDTPLGLIEWDLDLMPTKFNSSSNSIFHELICSKGRELSASDFFPEYNASELRHLLMGTNTAEGMLVEHYSVRAVQYCRWYNTPLYSKRRIVGYVSLIADVTGEQTMMSTIERKESEQSEILNAIIDAVITTNQFGSILSFNKSAERMFGYKEGALLGKSISLLMPSEHAESHDNFVSSYIESGASEIIESGRDLMGRRKDGSQFPMCLSVSELPSTESGMRRFIGTCHDQSSMKEQEKKLRQSQKMDSVGKMTGGLAHDFNNILGIISGYAELVLPSGIPEEKREKYILEILRASQRGANLTRKLLYFSKQSPVDLARTNLTNILMNMSDLISTTITPGIDTKFILGQSEAEILVDVSYFEDVIVNLCINAAQAMNGEGRLRLTLKPDVLVTSNEAELNSVSAGKFVILTVSDTGIGMSEETQQYIFEPFFTTKEGSGSGLGLSQVYAFVKQSQGFITVDSKLGEGTSFHLYFPQLDPQTVIDSDSAGEAVNIKGRESILLVDDEVALLNVNQELISDFGYSVDVSSSPIDALELVKKKHFDVVVSDVVMPDLNGFELADKINRINSNIKVILVSGFHEEVKRISASKSYSALLEKPCKVETLLTSLRRVMDAETKISE